MSFTLDPQGMLGTSSKGITGLPIVIGLPSPQAPVPNFVIGVTTEEGATTSNTLPGLQITAGDVFMKGARNGGEFTFTIILSETQNVKSQKIANITKTLQQISTIASTFMAAGGGVLPNISGITSNFAVSQLGALQSMKDGFQPILALNLYMPLSSISTRNPNLSSNWLISNIRPTKAEAERGFVVEVTLKELLLKRSSGPSLISIATNLANELIGPGVGSSIGGML